MRVWLQVTVEELGNGLILRLYHSEKIQVVGPRLIEALLTESKDAAARAKIIQRVTQQMETDFG